MPESVHSEIGDLIREILTDSHGYPDGGNGGWELDYDVAIPKLIEHVRAAREITLQMNRELTAENAQLRDLLREACALAFAVPSRADDSDPLFRLRALLNGSH